MLPVIWNDEALADLDEIVAYIATRNAGAAQRLKELIQNTGDTLSVQPLLYRAGRLPGTRECVAHPNYILVFQVELRTVRIVSVLHARQQYP